MSMTVPLTCIAAEKLAASKIPQEPGGFSNGLHACGQDMHRDRQDPEQVHNLTIKQNTVAIV